MDAQEFSIKIGRCTFVINKTPQTDKWLLAYWIENRGHYHFDFGDSPEKCAALLCGESLTKSMSDLKKRITISVTNEIGKLENWTSAVEIQLS